MVFFYFQYLITIFAQLLQKNDVHKRLMESLFICPNVKNEFKIRIWASEQNLRKQSRI